VRDEAVRDASGRDEFIVMAEARDPSPALRAEFADLLKRKLGIEVGVELAKPGELANLTQTEVRQKPIRLIDERF